MKPIYSKLAALLFASCAMGSCIEETLPHDDTMTSQQVSSSSAALNSFATGIAGFMGKPGTCYGSLYNYTYDLGYPGIGLIRDIMSEDMSINDNSWEYFFNWATTQYLGDNWTTCYFPWTYYYKLIANTHNILRNDYNENTKEYFGIAHFFRAWAYFDMARMFEYKKTGVSSLDAQAEANGIYGLTIPIITEHTTEDEARYLPRATCYEMYKFLLDELNTAETCLTGYRRTAKNLPDLSTVYGLKAKLYLDMASRLLSSPTDMGDLTNAKADLGATNYTEAATLAAEYARKTITESGATPLSKEEWYGGTGYTQGFNTMTSADWLLGISLSKQDLEYGWGTFAGMIVTEQNYGIGGYTETYNGERTISKALFDKIADADWRKKSWLAPEDAGNNARSKYYTLLDDETFNTLPPYVNFKFRPKEGNLTDFTVSAVTDYPLMRIEEMYFIEAEAKAYCSLNEGVDLLQNFMNTYRYTDGSYACNATNLSDFIDELMVQKRIEFWGEGLMFWDYKRLNKQIVRGYEGSNFPEAYQINSNKGFCAPWLNFYIPNKECGMNTAIRPNPDPSQAIPVWSNN